MFEYNSVQTHSEYKRGKGKTTIKRVTIRGKTGHKSVIVRNKTGRITQKSKKKLSKKEIDCIKHCKFVPGLFRDCFECLK